MFCALTVSRDCISDRGMTFFCPKIFESTNIVGKSTNTIGVSLSEKPNANTLPIVPLTNPISVPKLRVSITVDPIHRSMTVGILKAFLFLEGFFENTNWVDS